MEVSELEGVSLVEASQATQQVTVHYEPPATEERIKERLVEINYPPMM
jgi:copper chaperone CopZ